MTHAGTTSLKHFTARMSPEIYARLAIACRVLSEGDRPKVTIQSFLESAIVATLESPALPPERRQPDRVVECRLLAPFQLARRCGVHIQTVHRWCRRKTIPAFKAGPRLWRIPLAAANAHMARIQQARERNSISGTPPVRPTASSPLMPAGATSPRATRSTAPCATPGRTARPRGKCAKCRDASPPRAILR